MHQLERLLIQREAQRARLDREIEALRISLHLLEEEARAAAVRAATERAAMAAATAAQASYAAARPTTKPGSAGQSLPPDALPALFPPAQNGAIVCDACGHRNPLYVTDCEECDIPIRPRES